LHTARTLELYDYLALKAAALGVPFLPTHTGAGGDIIKNQEAFGVVVCPFTGV
jgi:acyl CoA:acetate/3-ketoacid CoA transferase alpha subunit